MASHSHILVFIIACFVSLISPAISKTCSTQNIGKIPFKTCIDLPVLDSYLHYTYNASNSSLSVAFVSTPSKPNNWVAWAINPTWDGMIGSQTFLAFRSGRGVVVKTYNISDYSSLVEGKLAFDFWNLRAESMKDGKIVILTSVKVPAGADSVNQVWQIGGNVTNGRPGIHDLNEANMNSKALLNLKSSNAPVSARPLNLPLIRVARHLPDRRKVQRARGRLRHVRNLGSIWEYLFCWVVYLFSKF